MIEICESEWKVCELNKVMWLQSRREAARASLAAQRRGEPNVCELNNVMWLQSRREAASASLAAQRRGEPNVRLTLDCNNFERDIHGTAFGS